MEQELNHSLTLRPKINALLGTDESQTGLDPTQNWSGKTLSIDASGKLLTKATMPQVAPPTTTRRIREWDEAEQVDSRPKTMPPPSASACKP